MAGRTGGSIKIKYKQRILPLFAPWKLLLIAKRRDHTHTNRVKTVTAADEYGLKCPRTGAANRPLETWQVGPLIPTDGRHLKLLKRRCMWEAWAWITCIWILHRLFLHTTDQLWGHILSCGEQLCSTSSPRRHQNTMAVLVPEKFWLYHVASIKSPVLVFFNLWLKMHWKYFYTPRRLLKFCTAAVKTWRRKVTGQLIRQIGLVLRPDSKLLFELAALCLSTLCADTLLLLCCYFHTCCCCCCILKQGCVDE